MFHRFTDWLLECRIKRLGRELRATARATDAAQRAYALIYVEMRGAIDQRSKGQVERLERERGLI